MSVDQLEDLHPNSLASRDYDAQQTLPPDLKQWTRRASRSSGRGAGQLVKEFQQGGRWPGQTSALDYFSLGLYDLDKGQRKRFISDNLHWPIHDVVNDLDVASTTVDKWQCTSLLEQQGIYTIPISFMVDPAGANYADTPVASTSAELAEFLTTAEFPLFAKPNNLLGSFGAFRIESFDGERVTLHTGEEWELGMLIEEAMSAIPYVIAPVIRNHDQIAEFADGLATLRTVNMVTGSDVRIDRVVLKIPVAGQIADNTWRGENFVANVDPQSGVIDRVIHGLGPDLTELSVHPDTGTDLLGMTLPTWQEVRSLTVSTALVFEGLRYQTQDIALTNDGPIVVEVNSGGSFILPQLASGEGLLTPENKTFFEQCGVNFKALQTPQAEAA